jgi:hypothetical protein
MFTKSVDNDVNNDLIVGGLQARCWRFSDLVKKASKTSTIFCDQLVTEFLAIVHEDRPPTSSGSEPRAKASARGCA